MATHHPGPDPYSASVYSTEDPYASSPTAASAPPQGLPIPLAFPGGGTHAVPSAPPQPQYTAYNPIQHHNQPPSYDAPSAPTNAPPPVPTASAPPIPSPEVDSDAFSPPPLNPTGPAYDARNHLPSQHGQAVSPSHPQYKAYAPPAAAGALNEPSAPQDFYRPSTTY